MKESGFFDDVRQIPVQWRDTSFGSPLFYQDARMLSAMFMAPLDRVRALLPSVRLRPLRLTPWHSMVLIAAYEYRACDIGPYNEVGILIPASLDRPAPVFTGLLRRVPSEPNLYILHLPVTTGIACDLGVESGAYPKFLADIEFKEDNDWVGCRVSEAGHHLLTLTVRKGRLRSVPRSRAHPINARTGRLLRSLVIFSEREESSSRGPGDARLELGDHRISQELRDLHLGRMLGYQYTPGMQIILTPILESFAI